MKNYSNVFILIGAVQSGSSSVKTVQKKGLLNESAVRELQRNAGGSRECSEHARESFAQGRGACCVQHQRE